MRTRSEKEKERNKITSALWKKNNPEKAHISYLKSNQWHKEHPRETMGYTFKYKYDLSLEQWDKMLIEQCGKCEICDKQFLNNRNEPVVDHNHLTGKVRALLCQMCNKLLGQAQDSPEILIKATNYLKEKI